MPIRNPKPGDREAILKAVFTPLKREDAPNNEELYEQIIGLLPQKFRQNSYGAVDGVRRLVKAYEEVCQEAHEWRHGHRKFEQKT